MSLNAVPTNLQSGRATDEVQELVGSPEALFVLRVNGRPVRVNGQFLISASEATAEHVQSGLEAETAYGPGNVQVSGGPLGTAPLRVVTVNGQADQVVPPMEVVAIVESVEARVATRGRPDGEVVVMAANLGDAPVAATSEETEVTVADKLPPGLKAVQVQADAGGPADTRELACSVPRAACTFGGELTPFDQIEMRIGVVVEGAHAAVETNEASVSGGETTAASVKRPVAFGGAPAPFGVESYEVTPETEGGTPDTQAGSHPFQMTGTVTMNQALLTNRSHENKWAELPMPVTLPRDLTEKLPPGLVGNATAVARCPLGQFLTRATNEHGEEEANENVCPPESAIGVAMVTVNEPAQLSVTTFTVPIFNVEPAVGEPARFGMFLLDTPVLLDASVRQDVRAGGDYGVDTTSSNLSETAGLLTAKLTFWGVPGDARHDAARGWGCLNAARGITFGPSCHPLEASEPPPFLSLSTSCTGPLQTSIEGDSWTGERFPVFKAAMPALQGCNRLPFSPTIQVAPDETSASSPAGLSVDVHVPQTVSSNPTGLAESAVKDITLALPEGMAINPASADGLQSCSEELVGFTGFAGLPSGVSVATFDQRTPGSAVPGVNFCAEASKVGTIEVRSPFLSHALIGSVYLASQNANPFGSLVAEYLVAEDPESGVVFKAAGEVHLTASGQLIATLDGNPQLPFEDAKVHFFDGQRAPLATPARCGTYTTTASFTPWSGTEAVAATSSFSVAYGPNGGECPGASLPFEPSLSGGSTNTQAGGLTSISTLVGRGDGQQNLQRVVVRTPPGLSGLLSGVKLCGEEEANAGTCGPESQIGETNVSVGVGADPYLVRGGRVYLTGPYSGAPFGLSIVTEAKAGPYDLGPVVVRAKIEVDPHTAALTIATDSSPPHGIPSILNGIPLHIRHVDVKITRQDFAFNPTNCSPLTLSAELLGDEGASSSVAVPFQVANCAQLKFAPQFSVSTSGRTSKTRGASLVVKLAYPRGSFGSEANMAAVKVDLPRQLPSRLTTLQKACTSTQFSANPAGCPSASLVGHVRATTPVLPVPLEGPAYFVSHGGEAFPSLIIVLQGYGVTIDLVGTTLIRNGITSSTFKTVPDVPVNTFQLTLPQGRFSALGSIGNLCRAKLLMPTMFTAQNGMVLHRDTKIGVTGCRKHTARHVSSKGS